MLFLFFRRDGVLDNGYTSSDRSFIGETIDASDNLGGFGGFACLDEVGGRGRNKQQAEDGDDWEDPSEGSRSVDVSCPSGITTSLKRSADLTEWPKPVSTTTNLASQSRSREGRDRMGERRASGRPCLLRLANIPLLTYLILSNPVAIPRVTPISPQNP